MNKFFYLPVFFIFCLIFCSGCVGSSKIETLENRVISLEMENTRQIQKNTIQEKIIKDTEENNELSKKNYASLNVELRKLRVDIQRLKGLIEETGHKFAMLDNKDEDDNKDKQIKELNEKIVEIFKNIAELEQYIGFESSKKPVDDTKTDDAQPEDLKPEDLKSDKEYDKDNPEAIYKHAKSLLDKEEYDASRLEFEKFINLFPDSKNADNARFWIAETHYREKWYEKSILEYQKVIEKYSTGNKVAAALLKQGYSFAELGEKANARLILKELIKKYPDSTEAGFAAKKLKSLN